MKGVVSLTNHKISKRQTDLLKALVEAKRQGSAKVNARDLAENVDIKPLVCYSNLKDMKKKGIVRCDGAVKPSSEWSVTKKGYELLAIATVAVEQSSRTKIVHEREHFGITTTKDTLTITGDSAPRNVITDSGTSVGLKTPKAELDVTSNDKRKIEFNKE